jgi:hypothetical protein
LDANFIIYTILNDKADTRVYKVKEPNQLLDIIDVNIDLPCYNINVSDNIINIHADNAAPNISCVLTCKNSADADQYYHSLFIRQQQQNYQLKG